jgi:hypothetical protein
MPTEAHPIRTGARLAPTATTSMLIRSDPIGVRKITMAHMTVTTTPTIIPVSVGDIRLFSSTIFFTAGGKTEDDAPLRSVIGLEPIRKQV